MTNVRRLRPQPAVAVELDEGRLRRQSHETGRTNVQGADDGRPHHPWRSEVYDLQMMAKIAVTLIDEVLRNVVSLEGLHEIGLREHLGFDELCFQVHALRNAADALQPQ